MVSHETSARDVRRRGESRTLPSRLGVCVLMPLGSGAGVADLTTATKGTTRVVAKGDQAPDFELPDEDNSVAELYGVWVEKKMYGKTFWGTQRATFIIDPDGTVAHVIPNVSPKTHDEQALAALANLRDAA